MIAVVAAMPEELEPFAKRASDRSLLARRGPLRVWSGRSAGRDVVLAVTGDGLRNAAAGAAALHALGALERVVVVGIAGAASEDLPLGALVAAQEVAFEDGARWSADARALDAAVRSTGARRARLVTAARIADTPAGQRALARAAVPSALPLAVDLESAAHVEAAAASGTPWTVLRVISDTAGESLPPLLNRARDDGGAVRRVAVATSLLGAPRALPVLWRMRGRLRAAGGTLADALERLLAIRPVEPRGPAPAPSAGTCADRGGS